MSKILFILSGNLSTTPRALKSLSFLLSNGYECKIILVNRAEQWQKKDMILLHEHGYNITSINLGRKPLFPWLIATIIEKISLVLYPFFKKSIIISVNASNKSSIILNKYIKKKKLCDYDLVLGFGSGALFPSFKIAKKYNIPFGLDIEDYFPGEFIRKDVINEKRRREFLMGKILPLAEFLTFSSPLIAEESMKIIGGHKNYQVILNTFNESEFFSPEQKNGKLKLIWFSQKITSGRGLELLFDAVSEIFDIELTLVGSIDPEFYSRISLELRNRINFIPALNQKELHLELGKYDVGLALELDSADKNRQLCLTNKIFAYAQAGLYILATDTFAQSQFMKINPVLGIVCKQSSDSIKQILLMIIDKQQTIRAKAQDRYFAAKELSWGKESIKLNKILKTIDF